MLLMSFHMSQIHTQVATSSSIASRQSLKAVSAAPRALWFCQAVFWKSFPSINARCISFTSGSSWWPFSGSASSIWFNSFYLKHLVIYVLCTVNNIHLCLNRMPTWEMRGCMVMEQLQLWKYSFSCSLLGSHKGLFSTLWSNITEQSRSYLKNPIKELCVRAASLCLQFLSAKGLNVIQNFCVWASQQLSSIVDTLL